MVLPQDIAKRLPKDKLLSEPEWRALGVQQSRGWGASWRQRCRARLFCSELGMLAWAAMAGSVVAVAAERM